MAFKEKFLKIVRENIESLYDAFVQMSRESLPKDADERYQYLKRTGYIARNDADVDVYVVRVASKHIPKFKWLYSNLFRTFPEVFSKDVDVVVWGCGCGLDLLALYDQAMTQKNPQLWLRVRHVTLVDISSAALNRAETIARVLFPTATFTAVICDLNQPEEIERRVSLRQLTAYVPRIHLISNLLDLFDEVSQFASDIKKCAGRRNGKYFYFNEFVIAFSPSYRNGRVARNIMQFRDVWNRHGSASEIKTVGSEPDNCEFCAFSYSTLSHLRDRCYLSYMRGKNPILSKLVAMCPETVSGFDFHEFVTALSKIRVNGQNFYRAYRWVDVDWYQGTIKRLVFVSMSEQATMSGQATHLAPCVIENVTSTSEDQETLKLEMAKKAPVRALKCLKERCGDDTAIMDGKEDDFVVLMWDGDKLRIRDGDKLSVAGEMMGKDFWQYRELDYSLYFCINPNGAEPLPDSSVMDEKQKEIIYSRAQYRKIRGGAGCGKSTTMMWHAVMSIIRTHLPVLLACKTVTLFNRNAKRMAATLLREIPGLDHVDSDLVKFMTLDKVLCEHQKRRKCLLLNQCVRCEGCNHAPILDCSEFHKVHGNWRRLSEEDKRQCCEICVRENIRKLSRKGSSAANNSTAYGAVLIDEVQSVDPGLVQAVVNLTYGGNPLRECYVFCDERQSLNPDAVEIDAENDNKLRVKIPDRGVGYGRWINFNNPYRVVNDFSGRLVDVAMKLQALTIAKYGAVELSHKVGRGQMSLSASVFSIRKSDGLLLDELMHEIKVMHSTGISTITIVCDSAKDVRMLCEKPDTSDWLSTHLQSQSHVKEQVLRSTFCEMEGKIHLTTVTLAQGWDFQNVIFVCTAEPIGNNVLENVLTGATRATTSMRILDRSPSGWLYETLKDFNHV